MDDIYVGNNRKEPNNGGQPKSGQAHEDVYVTKRYNRSYGPKDYDLFPFGNDFTKPDEPEPQHPEPQHTEPKRPEPQRTEPQRPHRAAPSPSPPERRTEHRPERRPERQPEQHLPPMRKKKSLFRRFLSLLMILALLFAVAVGMVYNMFRSVNYNETGHKDNVFLDSSQLAQDRAVKNILLLGVDRRNADDTSRSDTMLLVSIDAIHRKIKLTSFMRDSYVYIPEKKRNARLNAACAYGGAQMVMDTIEYNFNVKIDHYMLVDFSMFEGIINGLGGVKVDVTENEAAYMRNVVHLKNIQAGKDIQLNGKEALWYCRIRKLDSDFMRTQRQRKVMTALIQKAKRTNPFSLYSMGKDVTAQIETDMTPADLTFLAVSGVLSYLRYDVEQCSIPTEGTWQNKRIDGDAVLNLDLEANSNYLKEFLYGR